MKNLIYRLPNKITLVIHLFLQFKNLTTKNHSGKSAQFAKKPNFRNLSLQNVAIRQYTEHVGNQLKNGEIMK